MAAPQNLALTIQSTMYQTGNLTIVIGAGNGRQQTRILPPNYNPQDDFFWAVVLDRNSLQAVSNELLPANQNSTVPAGLASYQGNPQYLFIVVTHYLSTLHVPQGAWFTWLDFYGAEAALNRLEQVNTALSCGQFGRMSYAVVNAFYSPSDLQSMGMTEPPAGIEGGSIFNETVLTLSLMATSVNNQILYTPCGGC